jgi:hypothetical protein
LTDSSLTAFEQAAVAGLSERAALASRILAAWAHLPVGAGQTPRSLVDCAQLGLQEESATRELLKRSLTWGLVDERGDFFYATQLGHASFQRLSFALGVIEFYRHNVHRDATTASVVLTKPPQPSVLEQKLSELGWRTADLEPTQHAFHGIVRAASRRIVVMTPFFDITGARWLQEVLIHAKKQVERVLILRSLETLGRKDYPDGFTAISPWLKEQRVSVYNYSLPRIGGGRETFHAKAVLCDRSAAYLGSSNVNAASLEHSMEMGVVLRGRAAAGVAEVLDAVIRASTEWTWT